MDYVPAYIAYLFIEHQMKGCNFFNAYVDIIKTVGENEQFLRLVTREGRTLLVVSPLMSGAMIDFCSDSL